VRKTTKTPSFLPKIHNYDGNVSKELRHIALIFNNKIYYLDFPEISGSTTNGSTSMRRMHGSSAFAALQKSAVHRNI
jgi:hypothetical protein